MTDMKYANFDKECTKNITKPPVTSKDHMTNCSLKYLVACLEEPTDAMPDDPKYYISSKAGLEDLFD